MPSALETLLPNSSPVTPSSSTRGAFERLRQVQNAKDAHNNRQARQEAWQQLREERAAAQAVIKEAVLEALIARGGCAAPEALCLDVRAGTYAFRAALRALGQDGLIARARSGGDWRLTDWSREKLVASGRVIAPELDTRQRRAADLAERVLDGLRGEGGGVPSPVLSIRFLRQHLGCAWEPLSAALDVLEEQGKITRVFEGARLRGVRLAIPDTREAATGAALEVAASLADPLDDHSTSHRRSRLGIDLLELMARSQRAMSKAEMKEALHVGPVTLRRILEELTAQEMVIQLFAGTQSLGHRITPAGCVHIDAPIIPLPPPRVASFIEKPLEDRVLLALAAAHPQSLTREALQARMGTSASVDAALEEIEAAGGATRHPDGWRITEAARELCGKTDTVEV
jgi:DNA-binding MarR family transcriptional regulator